MQQAILLAALGATSLLLEGCSFSSESENCNGEGCSCSWTMHSFWARIHISGVHIEHASRIFYVPDVARDVPNATSAPCCSALLEQIDYDEGKDPSEPSKALDTFSSSCKSSPNKEIASAAKNQNASNAEKLRGLRKVPALLQQDAHAKKKLAATYEPIADGEEGQDCDVTTSHGFSLNNVLISSGSMKLRMKWADPKGNTPCCNALQPLLESVYFKGVPEADLPSDVRTNFCNSCCNSWLQLE